MFRRFLAPPFDYHCVLWNVLVARSDRRAYTRSANPCGSTEGKHRMITYRQEMRRCGKAACRGCQYGPSHGPYWYAYWREDGRVRRRYCGRAEPAGEDAARNAPAPRVAPCLHIRLLGGLEVERDGIRLDPNDWPRRSARKLLALLLLHPSGLPRDEASEMLWPERPAETAEQGLRSALHALRSVLEPAPRSSAGTHSRKVSWRLPPGEQLLRLSLAPDDWVDVHALAAARSLDSLDLEALASLTGLYRGELLPEFRYEEWTATRRESLRSQWHALSLHLSRRLVARGRVSEAIQQLELALADDGTQEEAARLLMTTLTAAGRRCDALRVYERLVQSLEVELSVPPDEISRSLADELRHDTPHRPAGSARPSGHIAALLTERIDRLVRQRRPGQARHLARLYAYRALALESHGEPEEALTSIESGKLAIASGDFPGEMARLLATESKISLRAGHPRPARESALQAEELARQAGELGLAAWALRLHAQAAQQLGQVGQAITLARSSTALYDGMGARSQALRSRRIVALNVWYAGRFPEAEVLYRRTLRDARHLGDGLQQAYVLCGLGSALLAQGNLEEAEPHLLEALALATRVEEHFLMLSTNYHLGNLLVDRSETEVLDPAALSDARGEAVRYLERVMSLARASHNDYMLVFGAVDLGVALTHWGQLEGARQHIELARRTLDDLQDTVSPRGWVLVAEAELALGCGNVELAVDRAASAVPLLELAAPAGLAQAHRVAAVARSTLGHPAAAAADWAASLAAASRHGQQLEELRTRRAMAQRGPQE